MAETMTKKNPRVHRETLPTTLAEALLNVPLTPDEGDFSPATFPFSHAERLMAARRELGDAVRDANAELAANPLMEIIAEHASRLSGKRGYPKVVVYPDGQVMLEVHYLPPGQQVVVKPKAKRKSVLPSIKQLREEAESLGIDWKPFGKGKKALLKALEAHTKVLATDNKHHPDPAPKPEVTAKPKPEPKPKPKRTKTAPAVSKATPVRLTPDSRHVTSLDDDEDDLDALFGGPAKRRPVNAPIEGAAVELDEPDQKPTPKVAPTPTPKRKPAPVTAIPTMGGLNLAAIVGKADDVDIEAILAKDEPKMPDDDDSGPGSDAG